MYSPLAAPPNHQATTPVNATPQPIQTADSIAASFVPTSCASRWKTSRSTSSSVTMTASSTAHCQTWTSMSTRFSRPSTARVDASFTQPTFTRWLGWR